MCLTGSLPFARAIPLQQQQQQPPQSNKKERRKKNVGNEREKKEYETVLDVCNRSYSEQDSMVDCCIFPSFQIVAHRTYGMCSVLREHMLEIIASER